MTAVLDTRQVGSAPAESEPGMDPGGVGSGPDGAEPNAVTTGIAVAVATAGAAVVAGSLFRGTIGPIALGVVGAIVGAGLVARGAHSQQRWLGFLPVPVALVVGAIAMAPVSGGGSASLPGLVGQALEAGGLEQAPVPFEPGWRLILVVLHATVAAAATALAVGSRRPRLGVAVPMPVIVGAVFLLPDGSEVVPTFVAAALIIAALAIARGAELADEGATDRRFERRRLARGALLLAAVLAVGVVVARTGFLFPDTDRTEVIPPQRPPNPPPEPDRVVMRVTGPDARGPWRLGVLDVYDGEALLLPSIDPDRLESIIDGALVASPLTGSATLTVELTDLRGRAVPLPAEAVAVSGGGALEIDPRTGIVQRSDGRAAPGTTLEVAVAPRPGPAEFAGATITDDPTLTPFAEVPPTPPAVAVLLTGAPSDPFDRLQFVRQAFYNRVVAAGVGEPVDVPLARVSELLEDGAEATPYEISVMEVLLARWAGIPARMGFGYFGGEEVDGATEFRPRHGAAWLEVHFAELGWVPIVGTPPRAKESLSDELQNEDQQVLPTEELGMVVYIPAELDSFSPLYQTLRYWLLAAVPWAAAVVAVGAGQPMWRKLRRSARRRRWAAGVGPEAEIWVAYAEFRDRMIDLNVGGGSDTPDEFLTAVEHDDQHDQLAALVTRATWGDLRGRVGPTDVAAAQDMAESLVRRVSSEQPVVNRVLAALSLASVRDPYTDEIPNADQGQILLARVGSRLGRLRLPSLARLGRLGRVLRRALAVGVIGSVIAGGVAVADTTIRVRGFDGARAPVTLPSDPPPRLGRLSVQREPDAEAVFDDPDAASLVTDGRVFTLRTADSVEGSIQLALLRPDVDGRDASIQDEIRFSIGTGRFDRARLGPFVVRRARLAEQHIWVWFPPTDNAMVTFVFRAEVEDQRDIVDQYLRHHLGLPAIDVSARSGS